MRFASQHCPADLFSKLFLVTAMAKRCCDTMFREFSFDKEFWSGAIAYKFRRLNTWSPAVNVADAAEPDQQDRQDWEWHDEPDMEAEADDPEADAAAQDGDNQDVDMD